MPGAATRKPATPRRSSIITDAKTRWTWLAALACAIVAGIVLAGCSFGPGNGHATVFTIVSGFSEGGPATTIDIVDIGVPGSQNVTAHSVRLTGISLASVPRSVHLRSVIAYPPGPGVGIVTGNLPKQCSQYKPYPITADVTPPHSAAQWNIVIAVTFAKPGRYNLHHVKIYYRTDGHRGWQYQDLNTTMVVSAAHKGAKPAFDGCPVLG
jgi:hypothetical protein